MTDTSKGINFILISSLSFAFMGAMVKFAGDIPLYEKVLFRNLISLIIAVIVVYKTKVPLFGKKENRGFLLLRSFFGLSGVVLYFYAIDNMYLADSSMLNKLSPFVVTLLAKFFLKEKIQKFQIPLLVIVFLASLMIIKPEFDLSIMPALAGLGSAIAAGSAYTVIRYLGPREKPATIVFIFSLISVVGMLIPTSMVFVMPTYEELMYLIGTGVFAAGGQFALTYAYRFAPASELAIYNYAHIIFSAIVGYIFWSEISDIWSLTGGAIIISVSVASWYFGRNEQSKSALPTNK